MLKKLFVLLFISAIFISCATQKPVSQSQVSSKAVTSVKPAERVLTVYDIKNAITEQQQAILDGIPQKTRVALLDIGSFDSELGIFATEEIIMRLVKSRQFRVIDRDSIETILKEQQFQLSGYVDDKTAVSIGKLLGAATIITGRIQHRYDQIDFSLKVLDVETAEILDLISIPIWSN
jgi:TolB-like protein